MGDDGNRPKPKKFKHTSNRYNSRTKKSKKKRR